MKRQLLLAFGAALLLVGWISAFLMRSLTATQDIYYLIPALLLGIGMGTTLKLLGGRLTAVVLALTAMASILTVNQLYPDKRIGFAGLGTRLQRSLTTGHPVALDVQESDKVGVFRNDMALEAFAAVQVNLFARLPGPAKMLAADDAGHLFVSIPQLGAVYRLQDKNNNGFADQPELFHYDLDRPYGLVWRAGSLYVAEPSRLLELKDFDNDGQVDFSRVIIEGLPDDGGHWSRTLAMGEDGYLYLSIGSRCNACAEEDERRGTVLKVDPDSGEASIFSRGLRNPGGLAVSPADAALWCTDNGRDDLGPELPPDELNRLQAGRNFGWPYCFGAQISDPQFGDPAFCRETQTPALDFPAHSAPSGMSFGTRLNAPKPYRQSLFVVLHGAWKADTPRGFKLVRIPFDEGQPTGAAQDFLSGWLEGDQAWGRPLDVLAGADGSLYLSDDRAEAIYRISWELPED